MKKKTMLMELNKQECCGCGTCVLVCPQRAITMSCGELGSLYPQINAEQCIACGLCERNCAYLQKESDRENGPIRAFAASMTDKETLRRSASGGVAAALSQTFVEKGGAVVGCALVYVNEELVPKHICVDELSDLWKLQGSKYVQSNLGEIFEQIKSRLGEGHRILFFGTPCQVDALRHYLRHTDTTNLFLVDLVCHGVPSAKLFGDYLKTLKGQVLSFSFRDKVFGWGLTASYTYLDRNGRIKKCILSPNVSSYYTYFLNGEIYRESCYSCKYANISRVGDLTIGDFWGIEQEHPEYLQENGGSLSAREGISALMVNNSHGAELLAVHGGDLETIESAPDRVAKWNRQLCSPSKHSAVCEELKRVYSVKGYVGIEKLFRKRLGLRYVVRRFKAKIFALRKCDL